MERLPANDRYAQLKEMGLTPEDLHAQMLRLGMADNSSTAKVVNDYRQYLGQPLKSTTEPQNYTQRSSSFVAPTGEYETVEERTVDVEGETKVDEMSAPTASVTVEEDTYFNEEPFKGSLDEMFKPDLSFEEEVIANPTGYRLGQDGKIHSVEEEGFKLTTGQRIGSGIAQALKAYSRAILSNPNDQGSAFNAAITAGFAPLPHEQRTALKQQERQKFGQGLLEKGKATGQQVSQFIQTGDYGVFGGNALDIAEAAKREAEVAKLNAETGKIQGETKRLDTRTAVQKEHDTLAQQMLKDRRITNETYQEYLKTGNTALLNPTMTEKEKLEIDKLKLDTKDKQFEYDDKVEKQDLEIKQQGDKIRGLESRLEKFYDYNKGFRDGTYDTGVLQGSELGMTLGEFFGTKDSANLREFQTGVLTMVDQILNARSGAQTDMDALSAQRQLISTDKSVEANLKILNNMVKSIQNVIAYEKDRYKIMTDEDYKPKEKPTLTPVKQTGYQNLWRS